MSLFHSKDHHAYWEISQHSGETDESFKHRVGDAHIEQVVVKENPSIAERLHGFCGELNELPASETFDTVLSKDTFEHIANVGALIDEVASRVRQGGLFVVGFSPVYFSPNGDHGRYRLPLPWLHACLPQYWVLKLASRKLGKTLNSPMDVGLNCLTYRQFCAAINTDVWECLSLRINPIDHRLSALFNLLRRFPSIEEYFTTGIYAVYRKRHGSALTSP